LFNADGKVAFFLGGQINCSTTIHNCSDILRVLSISDDIEEEKVEHAPPPPLTREGSSGPRGFFRSFRTRSSNKVTEVREAGMEPGLLNRIEHMNLKTQMRMFYTAYSKVSFSTADGRLVSFQSRVDMADTPQYLVLSYDSFTIEFYSPDILDMLIVNKSTTPFVGSDIFKTLGQHAPFMSKEISERNQRLAENGEGDLGRHQPTNAPIGRHERQREVCHALDTFEGRECCRKVCCFDAELDDANLGMMSWQNGHPVSLEGLYYDCKGTPGRDLIS